MHLQPTIWVIGTRRFALQIKNLFQLVNTTYTVKEINICISGR